MLPAVSVRSDTMGEPGRFRTLDDLIERFALFPGSPTDGGRVALIVRRGEAGLREFPESVTVTPEGGIPGDSWGRRAERNPEMQIAVIEAAIADLIANGQPLGLFGDGLFLDFDLSKENLPARTIVTIGTATLEVTPMPHNGCRKFSARFGPGALRFVSKPELRHRNLRGIYMRVIAAGDIRVGDKVGVRPGSGPK